MTLAAAAPLAPIGAHQLLVFLLQVALLLVVALCLGRLATRLRMPALVGELLTGVLLGPSLLAPTLPAVSAWLFPRDAGQMHLLDAVSQLGVLLLVGITGLHLDVAMVRRRSGPAICVSAAGLIIPFGLGVTAGAFMPGAVVPDGVDRPVFALFIGVAMSVSAIPVIAKTLTDMRLVHRNVGQLILTAGVVDDAVGWFLLSVVSAMATVGLQLRLVSVSLVYLVGFVVAAVLIGRPLVRYVLRLAARSTEPGPTIAVAAVGILLGGATTQALGMEPVFGAFVVGVLIGSSKALDPARLAPLRTIVLSVLAPIFLASAGLRMDLTSLVEPVTLYAALAALAVAILGKFAGAYLGARLSRLTHWEGLALGAGMNARGVVEVVVAMAGLRLGVLNVQSYTIVVLIAIVTSLMAPPLLRLAMTRIEHTAEERLRESTQAMWFETPIERQS